MPRLTRLLAGALIALSATAAVAASGSMTVEYKQSRRIALGGPAANVVIGDPNVADVTMVDARSIIVIGKGYGSTDVLVLDSGGRTLLDSRVTVVASDDARVTVYQGAASADFSCARRCQPMAADAQTGAAPASSAAPPAATTAATP